MKKIGFIFINKTYSIYHALSIAIELSKSSDFEVHILCTKSNHTLVIESLKRFDCKNIKIKILRPFWYFTIPHYLEIKLQLGPSLFYKYGRHLKSFDAFVCTLYEDLFLKKVLKNEPHIKYIFTNHGISNRAYSFDDRITAFDLFFLLDKKEKTIRQSLNQLTDINHAVTGFVKYDLVKDLPEIKNFDNDHPTILYNPHWDTKFSSFHKFGESILDFFANHKEYNLIFAPHAVLLERNWAIWFKVKSYKKYKNILIDLGSESSNNMSYTKYADLYLADVSSQAFEFLFLKERPCLFLDAHNLKNDKVNRPLSWDLGEIISNVDKLGEKINAAFKNHQEKNFSKIQRDKIKEMFYVGKNTPTSIAVNAIKKLLTKGTHL